MIDNNEKIVYKGKIGELVHLTQPDGRVFEQYRRTPGTRIVFVSSDNKVLITKEYRNELGLYDLRLPGGKVCDTVSDYDKVRIDGTDFLQHVENAAKKEALEETGLIVESLQLLTKSIAGATVEWDLYYFLVTEFTESKSGQQLEAGENINVTWMTPNEIRNAILEGKMHDWRTVGILLGLILPKIETNI